MVNSNPNRHPLSNFCLCSLISFQHHIITNCFPIVVIFPARSEAQSGHCAHTARAGWITWHWGSRAALGLWKALQGGTGTFCRALTPPITHIYWILCAPSTPGCPPLSWKWNKFFMGETTARRGFHRKMCFGAVRINLQMGVIFKSQLLNHDIKMPFLSPKL